MATTKTEKKDSGGKGGSTDAWTDAERAAMKERAREMKAGKRGSGSKADGESDLLAKIAEMPDADRAMAERIHGIVRDRAPELSPRTWYGMPAWANANGKVVCFFTPAAKFKERYASFGFNADANLDEGQMWPTSWALLGIGDAEAERIGDLVERAVS